MNKRFVKLPEKIIKALLLALFKEREIIFGRIEFSILQAVSLRFMKCESLGMRLKAKASISYEEFANLLSILKNRYTNLKRI
jgi:hypothetical protein